ncbi:chaplin [Streptomyces canus]|uniref:chaplin n=1 Tax=Streptomyces canus TaxID=58343 RepID=UPI002DDB6C0D|nr:chaplin [Streptomyces canus]
MKRAIRNSVIAVAVASGAMAVAGTAQADSTADGSAEGSPGVLSGNNIQLPVDVPVNVCGNTLNVVGLLNPAMGNRCANEDGKAGGGKSSEAPSGAAALGSAHGSPGVVSGNDVQLPVDLPVNLTGNSANLVGIGNPAFGNESVNGPADRPDEPEDRSVPSTPVHHQPSHPATPRSAAKGSPAVVQQEAVGALAETGAGSLWVPSVASLALLTAGAVLYRRSRPGAGGLQG